MEYVRFGNKDSEYTLSTKNVLEGKIIANMINIVSKSDLEYHKAPIIKYFVLSGINYKSILN